MSSARLVSPAKLLALLALVVTAAMAFAQPKPLEKLTLLMPEPHGHTFRVVYIGIEKGWFASEGLEIEFKTIPGGAINIVPQLAQGVGDVGWAGGYTVIQARAKGVPNVGINSASSESLWGLIGSSAGSITVRPDTMTSLMLDVFQSLRKDGFERVFCVSGQGDALHNQTMAHAIQRGRTETGIRGYFVVSSAWAERLGLDARAAHVLVYPMNPPPTPHADVHAGSGETSMMWAHYPRLVRDDVLRTLEPTRFDAEDLAEWRKGWANARRKTPHGYLGDPASADPGRGRMIIETQAKLITDAIVAKVESGSP